MPTPEDLNSANALFSGDHATLLGPYIVGIVAFLAMDIGIVWAFIRLTSSGRTGKSRQSKSAWSQGTELDAAFGRFKPSPYDRYT